MVHLLITFGVLVVGFFFLALIATGVINLLDHFKL